MGGVIAYMREEGWHVQTAPFEDPLPRPRRNSPEYSRRDSLPLQMEMFQFMLVDQNGVVILPNRMHNVANI
jgi:hypothetical protein